MKKAILFKKLAKGFIQCTACSHYCKIAQDKTGICGVRK
jgi:pyruvate formate lyase activating enzyme